MVQSKATVSAMLLWQRRVELATVAPAPLSSSSPKSEQEEMEEPEIMLLELAERELEMKEEVELEEHHLVKNQLATKCVDQAALAAIRAGTLAVKEHLAIEAFVDASHDDTINHTAYTVKEKVLVELFAYLDQLSSPPSTDKVAPWPRGTHDPKASGFNKGKEPIEISSDKE